MELQKGGERMEKQRDPAILFYPTEFIMETYLMTDEEIGKYIKLLCNFQFHGHLSEKKIEDICGGHISRIFNLLEKDKDGLYYHKRTDYEKERRKVFVDSRANNLKGSKKKKEEVQSTFDTDDFYNAALERSERFYAEKNKKGENIHKN